MTADILNAVAALMWPAMAAFALWLLVPTLRELSKRGAFTIKIAGFELTAQEASDQLRAQIADLQRKVAAIETAAGGASAAAAREQEPIRGLRVLWVDDKPKNNAALVAALEAEGHRVTLARDSAEATAVYGRERPDVIVTDIGRPEARDAGLALIEALKARGAAVPFALYSGAESLSWYADRIERAGALVATASPVDLMAALRAVEHKAPR